LMPGVPVIVAALVAVLVGVFNWWERPAAVAGDAQPPASASPGSGRTS